MQLPHNMLMGQLRDHLQISKFERAAKDWRYPPGKTFAGAWHKPMPMRDLLPPSLEILIEPNEGLLQPVELNRVRCYQPVITFQRRQSPVATVRGAKDPIAHDREK